MEFILKQDKTKQNKKSKTPILQFSERPIYTSLIFYKFWGIFLKLHRYRDLCEFTNKADSYNPLNKYLIPVYPLISRISISLSLQNMKYTP